MAKQTLFITEKCQMLFVAYTHQLQARKHTDYSNDINFF